VLHPESPLVPSCVGVQAGWTSLRPGRSLDIACHRRCRSPSPACCCQPGAWYHALQCCTSCSSDPRVGRRICRFRTWPKPCHPPRLRAGVGWSMPSGEQALHSPSHRSTTFRLHARSGQNGQGPSASTCSVAGRIRAEALTRWGAFTASVPFDRCLPEGMHPPRSALPPTLLVPLRTAVATSADRLQGFAPPTSP
jgi:hypothetical protein